MEFIASYSKSKGNERLKSVSTLSLQSEQAVGALAKHTHSVSAVPYLPLGG